MSERRDKMAALLQELAATYIRNEASSSPLITVTRSNVSPDFKQATIFITVLPDDREEQALVFLKRKGRELRHFVSQKGNFKNIPFFRFEIDRGEKNRQLIDDIVNQ